MSNQETIDAIVRDALDSIRALPIGDQVNIVITMSQLDCTILQTEAFCEWAKTDLISDALADRGVRVKLIAGHLVALGKGGETLFKCDSCNTNLRELFKALGTALDVSLKVGKIDGANIAVHLTVK